MIRKGDFAKIFEVSVKTIRLYEEKGLITPAHIDNYTGYRYYDEKNVEEMTKILLLKDLGLSLKEIREFNWNILGINEKIKKYEKQINKIKNYIYTLNNLLQEKEKITKMKPFINDENAVGKWKLIGISNTLEDALKEKYIDDEFKINELYLLPNGEEYWIIKWTKNYIYLNNNECQYEIKNNKMLLTIPDTFNKTFNKIATYEKIDNKDYTKEEIKIKDNTNLEFIKDKKLKGFWKSIDFIRNPKNFDPNNKYWKEKLYLTKISIAPDNTCIASYQGKEEIVTDEIKYTKDYFIELGAPNTTSKYIHKNIDNKDYIIVEWKSGDYVYGKMINGYYVLEKMKEN